MKVALIGFNDLQYLPYISKYITILDSLTIPYDIICWDREDTNSDNSFNSEKFYRFKMDTPPELSEIRKLPGIIAYSRYIRKLLKENKYDKLIMLATQSAVIIADVLLRKYKKRYIFDVRDYWHESFRPLARIEEQIVLNAGLNVLSSRGFQSWLPKADWVVSHNVHINDLLEWINSIHEPPRIFLKEKIIINFIGQLRYEDEIKRIIDRMGGYSCYIVNYYGSSALKSDISTYAKKKFATNIYFHGRYSHADRFNLYKESDFVLSNYDTKLIGERTALNNKLYEAVLSLRPIIVSKGTFLEELVIKYGLGFAIDTKIDDIHQHIQDYIKAFNARLFLNSCEQFIKDTLKDDMDFKANIINFLI